MTLVVKFLFGSNKSESSHVRKKMLKMDSV